MRMLRLTIVLAAAIPLFAQSDVTLQRAIRKETVEGDLKGAIELYRKTVAEAGKDRNTGVQALLHLAQCYDALDAQAELRNTYERIVRQFPSQTTAVADARKWLDAHRIDDGPGMVRVEQVWSGPAANTASSFSADGRLVAFVRDGNVAIHDLRTGEDRSVTRDAASNAWAREPIISPDGKQVAYRWAGGQDDSIRIIASDGTRMNVVARRREYSDTLSAWSADGKTLALVHYNAGTDETRQILLIDAGSGATTQLRTGGWGQLSVGGFSPDGQFLVYSRPKDVNGPQGIFAIRIDGQRETAIVEDSASNTQPLFSPDGSRIAFLSNRSGSSKLWSVRVQDGAPIGEPEEVKANVNLTGGYALGFTKDGSYNYWINNNSRDAYVAEIDPVTHAIGKPALVSNRSLGSNLAPSVSPDGRRIAFLRRSSTDTPFQLVVRSVADGSERTIVPADGLLPSQAPVFWLSDNRTVLLMSESDPVTRRSGALRTIDTESATTTAEFKAPGAAFFRTMALSPDGKTLYYSRLNFDESAGGGPGDLKSIYLLKRDLATATDIELHHTKSTGVAHFGLSVSPDGSQVAFLLNVPQASGYTGGFQAGRSLFVMPAAGGTPREIYKAGIDDLSINGALMWTRDGKHLIVGGKCGAATQLCEISTAGGALRPLGLTSMGTTSQVLSHDGRRIYFTGTVSRPEVWAIRNPLPRVTTASR